jgi:RimJ/RimL family protein N-acetyltransferase
MNGSLLVGNLVRLTAEDSRFLAEVYSRWSRDSEYWRLMDSGAPHPFSKRAVERFLQNVLDEDQSHNFPFSVRTLADDRLIGDVGLGGVSWAHGDAFVGIALGERSDWGKGYGTDAMRLILRYAFEELNLRRVTLNVFDYNSRAVRSYEKVGFRHEGCVRQALHREGQRWDVHYMGILREEWHFLYGKKEE